jgi:hypothetical protein
MDYDEGELDDACPACLAKRGVCADCDFADRMAEEDYGVDDDDY